MSADQHRAWLDEHDRLMKRRDEFPDPTPHDKLVELAEIWARIDDLSDRISRTRANTLDGLRVQVEALARTSHIVDPPHPPDDLPYFLVELGDGQVAACVLNMRATLATLA